MMSRSKYGERNIEPFKTSMCNMPFCYDSTIYTVCVGQNTTIFRQQILCVQESSMFRPRIGYSEAQNNSQQDRQCTYNVTFRRVRATIVAVEKQ